jgi:hypothetical protein
MGSKSTPAPPDYTGAANTQAAASRENVITQNYANRPEVYTPWGSQTWNTYDTSDPATGQRVTQWQQSVNLDPSLQNALDSQIAVQQGRSNLAQGFMQNVENSYAKPFDWSNLPAMTAPGQPGSLQTSTTDYTPGLNTSYNFGGAPAAPTYDTNYRNQIANSLLEQMAPYQQMAQQSLETKLSNRGFQQGTTAYQRALDEMNQRQSAERYNAFNVAGQEAQNQFGSAMQARQQAIQEAMSQGNFGNQALQQASGMDLARMGAQNAAVQGQYNLGSGYSDDMNRLRQQAISEQAQARGMSLNEMNALLTGQQVGMPQFPSFTNAGLSETPQLLNAANMGYNAQMDAYNAQQGALGGLMSGVGSIGAAAIPFAFSDIRLKSNIEKVGNHPAGVGVYEYDIFDRRERGVIAQELLNVRPDLVALHPSGYLMVNYSGLIGA